jgi:hypothetical protein
MQCLFLIKLLNKRKIKLLQIKKEDISHTKTIPIICANAQHLAKRIKYINIKIREKK